MCYEHVQPFAGVTLCITITTGVIVRINHCISGQQLRILFWQIQAVGFCLKLALTGFFFLLGRHLALVLVCVLIVSE